MQGVIVYMQGVIVYMQGAIVYMQGANQLKLTHMHRYVFLAVHTSIKANIFACIFKENELLILFLDYILLLSNSLSVFAFTYS